MADANTPQNCLNCGKPVNLPGGEHYHIIKYMNQAPAGDGIALCSLVCLVQWGTKYATYKTVQGVGIAKGLFDKIFKR